MQSQRSNLAKYLLRHKVGVRKHQALQQTLYSRYTYRCTPFHSATPNTLQRSRIWTRQAWISLQSSDLSVGSAYTPHKTGHFRDFSTQSPEQKDVSQSSTTQGKEPVSLPFFLQSGKDQGESDETILRKEIQLVEQKIHEIQRDVHASAKGATHSRRHGKHSTTPKTVSKKSFDQILPVLLTQRIARLFEECEALGLDHLSNTFAGKVAPLLVEALKVLPQKELKHVKPTNVNSSDFKRGAELARLGTLVSNVVQSWSKERESEHPQVENLCRLALQSGIILTGKGVEGLSSLVSRENARDALESPPALVTLLLQLTEASLKAQESPEAPTAREISLAIAASMPLSAPSCPAMWQQQAERVLSLYDLAQERVSLRVTADIGPALIRSHMYAAHSALNEGDGSLRLREGLTEALNIKDYCAGEADKPLYDALLESCMLAKDLPAALSIYQQMKQECLEYLDEKSFALLLRECCNEGDLDSALALLKDMRVSKELDPPIWMYNLLLRACASTPTHNADSSLTRSIESDQSEAKSMRALDMKQRTERLFAFMEEAGLSPDEASLSFLPLVSDAADKGEMYRAISLLEVMKKQNITVTKAIHHEVIRACGNFESPRKASPLLVYLTTAGVGIVGASSAYLLALLAMYGSQTSWILGVASFSALIYHHGPADGRTIIPQIRRFIRDSAEYGRGTAGIASHTIHAVSEEGCISRALHILQKMRDAIDENNKPDAQTFNLLLNVCLNKQRYGMAITVITNADVEGKSLKSFGRLLELVDRLVDTNNIRHARGVMAIAERHGVVSPLLPQRQADGEDIVDLSGLPSPQSTRAALNLVLSQLEEMVDTWNNRGKISLKFWQKEKKVATPQLYTPPTSAEEVQQRVPHYLVFVGTEESRESLELSMTQDFHKASWPWLWDHSRPNSIVVDCSALKQRVLT